MQSLQDFSEMTIKIQESSKDRGVYHIGPIPQGYGMTIGNSLRRVLLSSLEGAAVTSIKVEGIEHEFSTIKGVLEDVVEILLRIKSLKVRSHSSEPQKISIKASGEGQVMSGDIDTTADVEIIDKNLLIATLTEPKAKLNIDMIVEKGIGYMRPNENLRSEAGLIPLDAEFSPVKLVEISVEPSRVGNRTDFEVLIVKITTNSLIDPAEAIQKASDILRKVFGLISVLGDVDKMEILDKQSQEEATHFLAEKETKANAQTSENLTLVSDWSDVEISETNFPTRVKGAVVEYGVKTVGELLKLSREEISEIPGLGEKSLRDLEDELKKMGLVLIDQIDVKE